MGKSILIILFVFMSFSSSSYCQLWKQYVDSAKYYNIQKEVNTNIKYLKTLKMDSMERNYWICSNLAASYERIKQYNIAVILYLETEELFGKLSTVKHPWHSTTIANLFRRMEQYDKALPFYIEAMQTEKAGDWKNFERSRYPESCINLANLYWIMNQPKKANEFYTEAFKAEKIQLEKVFQFSNEREKQFYLGHFANFEDFFLSFNKVYPQSNGGDIYDVSLSYRNLILSSSVQFRRLIHNTTDTGIKNMYDAWIKLRQELSYWYTQPVTKRPTYMQDMEDETNIAEKNLTRLSSVFKQAQNGITWKNIQQNLKSNEAAIEFVKFNFYTGTRFTDSIYYVALLLTNNNTEPQLIPLFEDRQLNDLVRGNTYQAITTFYKMGATNAAYNLIWPPIEKHLKGIKKIYFAPAGLLYRISLSALPINDHQVLSDKYQLVQLNTTASVADQSENFIDTSDKIYLYGGIKYNVDSATLKQTVLAYKHNSENTFFIPGDLTRGNWEYLPGTETEIEEIDSLSQQKNYSVRLSSGVTASEESIKAINDEFSPSVLHIATHGFFFPDPKKEKKDTLQKKIAAGNVFKQSDNPLFRSGLLFAGANNAWTGKQIKGVEDGILTAFEVSNLYLPNTKLVVLSACETGLGDIQGNEGVYGLQRAFKIAGVKNLIMSLWKVPDKETAEFMQELYKNIFNRQSIDDAFYHAQTIMRNKYRSNPYKWAAWILVK